MVKPGANVNTMARAHKLEERKGIAHEAKASATRIRLHLRQPCSCRGNEDTWTTDLRDNDFVVSFTYADGSGWISASITLNGKLFDRRLSKKGGKGGKRVRRKREKMGAKENGPRYRTLHASKWVSSAARRSGWYCSNPRIKELSVW